MVLVHFHSDFHSAAKRTFTSDYPVMAASVLSLDSANLLESLNTGL